MPIAPTTDKRPLTRRVKFNRIDRIDMLVLSFFLFRLFGFPVLDRQRLGQFLARHAVGVVQARFEGLAVAFERVGGAFGVVSAYEGFPLSQ